MIQNCSEAAPRRRGVFKQCRLWGLEDPMDVNLPSLDVDLKSLESNYAEADTHLVFSTVNSTVEHTVIVS